MKKSYLGIGVATLAIIMVAGIFGSCRGHSHKKIMTPERAKKMAEWITDDVLDDVDATDEQREKINVIKDKAVDELMAAHKSHDELKNELIAEWLKDEPDEANVYAVVDKGLEQKRIVAHKIAGYVLEVHKVLTPEQRSKIAEKINEHLTH